MTSLLARAHLRDLESSWMQWLKKCSALKGTSGKTLLHEYANNKDAWSKSLMQMRSERYCAWPFLRGTLSVAEIADARRRYLDRYVFVAGEHDASAYVEALLVTEKAQIQLRLQQNSVVCPGCADRDAMIAKLQLALEARNLRTDVEVDAAAIAAIFHRYFLLSDRETCTRTEVRECIERVLQQELGNGVSLPNASPAWTTFLRERLNIASNRANSAIRCQRRLYPLPLKSPESVQEES